MKAFLTAVILAGALASPVLAAEPSPSPHPAKALPIRGVTVDVQKMDQAPSDSGATHIEAPPLRMFRVQNAAPPAANEMAAPAPAAAEKAAAPAQRAKPAPSASPTPRSR
jgi:hypothetical protein